MHAFDLRTNPFAVLGVSPRDGRDAITRALEQRLGDPEIDEDFLHQAQRSLMAPRPRLQAEATWLIGLAPSRVQVILAALGCDDRELMSALSAATGLARANLAAQIASARPSSSIIDTLIGAYDEIDQGEVTEIINTERAVAGFPAVEQSLLEETLGNVRSHHLGVALQAVTAAEHPGRLMTRLVEAWFEARGPAHDFLEALAERYDNWSAPILGKLEERLDGAIAHLRTKTTDSTAGEDLIHVLEEWDEYSQPRQLIFKNTSMNRVPERFTASCVISCSGLPMNTTSTTTP
jgi:hypothetical protein